MTARAAPLVLSLLLLACGGGGGAPTADPGPVATPGPSPGAAGTPDLGPLASFEGYRPFPSDDPWNRRVDQEPVDSQSDVLIASMGVGTTLHPDFGADWNGEPFGIPYVVVGAGQARVPVTFSYADESDPGPYPIPSDAPVEGGAGATGDRHVLVLDRDARRLYELFDAWPVGGGWEAGSGAVFDLDLDMPRPAGWTSADAAGLPILPGLARYDEVAEAGEVRHALRFTAARTRRAYVAPARHYASSNTDPGLPPMGMRIRLAASFDVTGFPPEARAVLVALKRYGMILADNGSDGYVSGTPDSRWDDDDLNTLKQVRLGSFEVVEMGTVVTN